VSASLWFAVPLIRGCGDYFHEVRFSLLAPTKVIDGLVPVPFQRIRRDIGDSQQYNRSLLGKAVAPMRPKSVI
jgi:hypothetical protein